MRVFLYGTLLDDVLRNTLAGAALHGVPATLPDHTVLRQDGADLPYLKAQAGQSAAGLLVEPTPDQRARLDAYETPFDYHAHTVTVQTDQGPVAAVAYYPQASVTASNALWSFAQWQSVHAPLSREMAVEIGSATPALTPDQLRARWNMIGVRAASRLRARADTAPATVRRGPDTGGGIHVRDVRASGDFHRFQSFTVTHPTFQGGQSLDLPREVYVGPDAALVLPYDPATDHVLLVEQIRMGPLIRTSANPWSLEPVAGIIDAGETPAQAVLREAEEEAGLHDVTLEFMFSCYPTPGGATDYHYCYLGLAKLPHPARYTGGLVSEAEDLRLHILPFDQALSLVETGEANIGPLITMLYWLDRNRARLRGSA